MAYRVTASRFTVTVAGVASLGVWHMALPARIRRSDTHNLYPAAAALESPAQGELTLLTPSSSRNLLTSGR